MEEMGQEALLTQRKEGARQALVDQGPGPTFTADELDQHRIAYEDCLIDRYRRGLSLSKSDKREARKLILARKRREAQGA